MSSAFDRALAYAQEDAAALAQNVPDPESQFVKGVRAGTYGLGSSLRNAAGAVGGAFGADDFAAGQYQEADRLAQLAGQTGPRVTSYKDVNGLRDAVDYGMGVLGQTVPSAAIGIVPGMAAATPLRALAGATLAYTPMEMGDTVAKMRAANQEVDAGRALGIGALSAAGQAIVPTMVGGKIVGQGAKAATGQSMRQILGKNLVQEGAIEGVSEGASEALKQYGATPDAPLDWEQIKENAVAGTIGGAGMGTIGAAGDIAHAAPRNAWIGAKNMAQSGVDAVKGAGATAKEYIDPLWEGLKPSVDAGIAKARGLVPEGSELPQMASDVAEFTKKSWKEQTAAAKAAYKNIMEADDVPAAIKEQAKEWLRGAGDTAGRAALWTAEQTMKAVRAGKEAVPEDLGTKLRNMAKPATDMADTILNSDSAESIKRFAGKTTDEIKRMGTQESEQWGKWAGETANSLLKRTNLSDERREALSKAMQNLGDKTNQITVATIAKAVKGAEASTKLATAGYNKIKNAYDKMFPDNGSKKKSEDFEGLNRLIYDRVMPVLEARKPEFIEDDGNITKLGGALRMFMHAAAEGKDLRLAGIDRAITDMLGGDTETSHEILNATHEFITGKNPDKIEKLFRVINDEKAIDSGEMNLGTAILKYQSLQAPERTGVKLDPNQLAKTVMQWARGEHTKGMTPSQAAYADETMKSFLRQHFGTDADKILRVAEKQAGMTKNGAISGKTNVPLESERDTPDGAADADSQRDARGVPFSYYGRVVDEDDSIPEVYESAASHKTNNPNYQYEAPVDQMLKKLRTANPDKKVHFVNALDYAAARDMSAEDMRTMLGGRDPSTHGFIKLEGMTASDALEPHQLRRMRGELKSKNHPDAIPVEGRTIVYDSRRIAHVMHTSSRDEWTDLENAQGMKSRLAVKFAEGIAKLTQIEKANLKVRPDHVIGTVDGKDLTWGEAQAFLKQPNTMPDNKLEREARLADRMYEEAMKPVPPERRKNAWLQSQREVQGKEDDLDLFSSLSEMGNKLRAAARKSNNDQRVAMEQGIRSTDDLHDLHDLHVQVDTRVQELEDEMAQQVKNDMKAEKVKGLTRKDWIKEFVRRINDMKENYPPDGYVEAVTLSDALRNEVRARSGEDTRSRVMDTGMETRDGISLSPFSQPRNAVGLTQPAGPLGLKRAGEEYISRLNQRRAEMNSGKAPVVEKQASGSGRMEGDPEGQIHDAAATLYPSDLQRNRDGRHNQPADPEAVKALELKKFELKEVQSPLARALHRRLEILGDNIHMMSEKGTDALKQAMRLVSLEDIKKATDPIVAEYKDRIMAPGQAAPGDIIAKRGIRPERNPVRFQNGKAVGATMGENAMSEVDDPISKAALKTAAYPTKGTIEVKAGEKQGADYWVSPSMAARENQQVARTRTYYDKRGRLQNDAPRETGDLISAIENLQNVLAKKGRPDQRKKAVLQAAEAAGVDMMKRKPQDMDIRPGLDDEAQVIHDASLNDQFRETFGTRDSGESRAGGPPSPKVVAAKKAAFLQRAASGDPALIEEVRNSDDAKGLQRALGALYENRVDAQSQRLVGYAAPDLVQNLANAAITAIKNYHGTERKTSERMKLPIVEAAVDAITRAVMSGTMTRDTGRHYYESIKSTAGQLSGSGWRTNASVQIANQVLRGPMSVREGVQHVLSDPEMPESMKVVARAVEKIVGDVKVVEMKSGSMLGAYNFIEHTISLNDVDSPQFGHLARTFLHEAVHAATIRSIANNPELSKAFDSLMNTVYEANPYLTQHYGMTNIGEFVAEGLTNPMFQKELAKIKGDNKVGNYIIRAAKNAWDKFTYLMREALGLKSTDTALAQFLDLSGMAMKETGLNPKTHTLSEDEAAARFTDYAAQRLFPLQELTKHIDAIEKIAGKGVADLVHRILRGTDQDSHVTKAQLQMSALMRQIMEREYNVPGSQFNQKELGLSDGPYVAHLRRILEPHINAHPNQVRDAASIRMGELVRDPSVAYGLQTKKYSMESKGPTSRASNLTPEMKAKIAAEAARELGNSVMVDFPDLFHAGEFGYDPKLGADLISVSKHALNPMSTYHHESLHAFFKQLFKSGNADVTRVLMNAASKPAVTARLKELLANQTEAYNQLSDPEERAAYMYQFWRAGDAKLIAALKGKPEGILNRIKDAILRALKVWTNDERALHIMEYLKDGTYAKEMSNPTAVHKSLMEAHRSKALETLKDLSEPLTNLAETVISSGQGRLRDTGNPHLIKLADLIKPELTSKIKGDPGWIAAARMQHSEFINRLSTAMSDKPEVMKEALEALQTGTKAASPEARIVQAGVRKILDDAYDYMWGAGVEVNDLGYGKDYFPRQWDAHYLSTAEGKEAFFNMARKYSTEWKNPELTYYRLVGTDGAALPTVDRPGLDAKKERSLSFISHADAAPFMVKDLGSIVNNYLMQVARRSEWTRRFGDDNGKLGDLLEKAAQTGASERDIEAAKQYVAGVNGTLGDDLNPTLRRYMGNMVVYQNVRLLPLAIFSSIVDPMGILVRGGEIKDAWAAFKRGIKEIPKGLKGDTSLDAQTRLAQDLDVIDNAMMQHILGSSYTQGMVGNTARKINDAFFRFNLMEQFNRSMRVGATQAALKFIAKHADAKASPHSARWMAELGLKAGDVQMGVDRIKISEAEGLTPEQAARMKVAINRWVDGAILRPDAADKPIWMNDPHFMLISHLKQFVYSFHHTIIDRVVHEAKNDNYTPAISLASYVPVMFAADMAKGLLQGGGDEPEWKKKWGAEDYFMNAVERAGLFGVGQFGVEAIHGNYGALTGPTIEQLTEGIQVLGGTRQFKSFAIHSLPANSVYATAAREGRNDTFDNPE